MPAPASPESKPPRPYDDIPMFFDGEVWQVGSPSMPDAQVLKYMALVEKRREGGAANGAAAAPAPPQQASKYAFVLIWRQTLNVQLHDLAEWVEARGRKTARANLFDAAERLSAMAIKSSGALIGANGDWWSIRQIRAGLAMSNWTADTVMWWFEDNGWLRVNRTRGKAMRDERTLTIPKGIKPAPAGWPLR